MINLTVNGVQTAVTEGTTILEAAQGMGIRIPTLCYLKDISDIASCRMCVVEVEGREGLAPACSTPVEEGMQVVTESDKIRGYRKTVLKLLADRHGFRSTNYCFSCSKNGACELQALCREYGIVISEAAETRLEEPVLTDHPFFAFNPNLCIQCQRCVGACNREACNHELQTGRKGIRTIIDVPFGPDWKQTGCENCGCCVQACPTGALTMKRRKDYRSWEIRKVLTTCPHCATGCQYYVYVKDNRIVDTEPADGPSNHGRLCVKGRSASFDFAMSGDRITDPLIKDRETGRFRKASWDEALDLAASRFMQIRKQYGSDALAGFACSRSPNEDVYMVQKMVRTCFGSNNVDNCARVCHSSSVTGLAKSFGSGAMTNPIGDITTDVDMILLVGSNPEEAHPVVGMQIRRAVENGTRLVVVDPRDTRITRKADIHLKLRPGTNVAFSLGMLNVILNEGLADQAFIENRTEGFEELKKTAMEYPPEKVAEICHISADDLRAAARMYALADKAPIIYCLGVTEHTTGVEGVMSLANLAMAVGKMGRPGCGVNPLRGQNNVQGGCDMGAMPNKYPGYQDVTDDAVREKFEKAWGVPLSPKTGIHATEVFPAAIEGKIRGLYIYGEDPVVTDADTGHIIKALKSLDFFVIQELFLTETAQLADIVLPGRSYLEKEGTFSNTERRQQRVRKAITVPGNMRLDTDIIIDLMNRMGYPQKQLTAAQIFDEMASLTPSFAGISHRRLDSEEVHGQGLVWPCPTEDHPGTPILHVGRFSRGLGLFSPAPYRKSAELPDEEYPMILMTGRILSHYTTRAMTGRTKGMMDIEGHAFIEMNSRDAEDLGIWDGERVRIRSRRGEITAEARVSGKCSPGETWMPFHFPDGDCNWLTNAKLDPYSRIPEYKVCAVRVEKIPEEEAYTADGTYITQEMVAREWHARREKTVKDIVEP